MMSQTNHHINENGPRRGQGTEGRSSIPHISRHLRSLLFTKFRDNWPSAASLSECGLSLQCVSITDDNVATYRYTYDQRYTKAESLYLRAAQSHDPNQLVHVLLQHPWHVPTLFQLSIVAELTGDREEANNYIARALCALETASTHVKPTAPTQGESTFWLVSSSSSSQRVLLPVIFGENTIFYEVMERHIQLLCNAGLYRTALEFGKMVLSLDLSDPISVLLFLDFYAIRSSEWFFLEDLGSLLRKLNEQSGDMRHLLPNMMYGSALSSYLQSIRDGSNPSSTSGEHRNGSSGNSRQGISSAVDKLTQAILMHPYVITMLLSNEERCLLNIDGHPYFDINKNQQIQSDNDEISNMSVDVEMRLCRLYVQRNGELWKRDDIQHWLYTNVTRVLVQLTSDAACSSAEFVHQRILLCANFRIRAYSNIKLEGSSSNQPLPQDAQPVDEDDDDALDQFHAALNLIATADERTINLTPWLQAVLESADNVYEPPQEEEDIHIPDD
jgi:tetratricopeptide (TPR) repeat protein